MVLQGENSHVELIYLSIATDQADVAARDAVIGSADVRMSVDALQDDMCGISVPEFITRNCPLTSP